MKITVLKKATTTKGPKFSCPWMIDDVPTQQK